MRDCVCKVKEQRRVRLDKIPTHFKNVELSGIVPRPDVHPFQTVCVPAMKANPAGSYFLSGKTGKGKSMLMWALYREAVMQDKKVVACTLTELLDEYRKFIQLSMAGQKLEYPRIVAGDLRQNHTKYSIFFDDIDKARPTEYAMEQLFDLSNAIYDFQHQIVVTTNLTLPKLTAHFEKADERFGSAIVRRLVNNGMVCEFF
jgi:DNA replication protein DnaC